MLYELDNETINFLCKHKLTLNQFALCLLIHKQDGTTIAKINHEIGILGDYLIPTTKGKYKTETIDLIDRGYIKLTYKGDREEEKWALDNFTVTEKFLADFTDPTIDLFEEFWTAYPKSMLIQGIERPSKNADYDDLKVKYLKAIKGNTLIHRDVMNKLERYKETHAYADLGIEKFVGSRQWENMEYESKVKTRGY